MRVRVKICGLTTDAAVHAAVESGADAVGFVFADSPRRVSIERARLMVRGLPPFVGRIAVFRHAVADEIRRVVDAVAPTGIQVEPTRELIDTLGPELPWLPVFHDSPRVVEEIRDHCRGRPDAWVHLEGEGRGGRGIAVEAGRAREGARIAKLVLAGGLDPENVGRAIRDVRPAAVDVSSGVESAPGVKDPSRMRRFVEAVRAATFAMETDR